MNDTRDAEELIRLGFELFPLKPKDKTPLLRGWRTAPPLTTAQATKHKCGVRLTATQLVIDVDQHEGRPHGSIGALAAAFGDAVLRAPRVDSRHGQHLYFSLPSGFSGKLYHTLKQFPGTEFKTAGRYVVAPGEDGYEWSLAGGKFPPPVVPDSMLQSIVKPSELAATDAGGNSSPAGSDGEAWGPEELAAALSGLDPTEFREHDDWFSLMCACHEVTNGAGLDEFVAWSVDDPEYIGHEGKIRARWSSFVPGRDGNAGAGTLAKVLLDRGLDVPGSVSARSAAADFDELASAPIDPLASEPDVPAKKPSLMTKMSERFKAVDDAGKLRIYSHKHDAILKRDYWVKYDRQNFLWTCKSVYHYPEVQCGSSAKGDPKFHSAAEHWLECNRKKTTYEGLVYMPEHDGEKTPDGRLNIWKGFAVKESSAGTWNLLKEVMFETLCSWDTESYEYVMNWMARAIQRPWEPGGVAIVFKGKKGTGKSTLGSYLCRLFGRHGMQVTSPSLLTGRFNAHLRDTSMLFGDEAFWAGDKVGEGVLKGLITESYITYEGKGENAESGRNCTHLMNASNEKWVVPAGFDDERRFAVFEVGEETRHAGYWKKLRAEMENGGLARMLWDLLRRDISEFNVFAVPQTGALAEQKIQTMDASEQWLWDLVESGYDGLNVAKRHDDWYDVTGDELEAHMDDFFRRKRFKPTYNSIRMHMGKLIMRMLPGTRKARITVGEERKWGYVFPSPSDALAELEKRVGKKPDKARRD